MTEMYLHYNQLGKAGYNRAINRQHVNRIKRDFHEDMVQPAIVSFRDGRYWIVDHQHQTQAIFEMNGYDPLTNIRCDVREGLTYEQEADLYIRLNTGTKQPTFSDKLTGLIEAKDETALKFRDLVESCGYVVGGSACNSLKAVSAAWRICKKDGGDELLSRILTLTKKCWPDNQSGVDCRIIDGISLFLKLHGSEYQQDRFVKNLSPIDPKEIVRKASTFCKQMDSKSFTMPYCTYTVLLNSYNTGLRNKLIPKHPIA